MTHELSTQTAVSQANSQLEAAFFAAEAAFFATYPTYAQTVVLDEWRQTEYGRLDEQNQIYLDYTGGGLYGISQLQQHMQLLQNSVLGNPHSANPTSRAMTDLVEGTRRYLLDYFNASPDEYVAVFTLNASNALKLVGESYPFCEDSHYLLTFDNHNSVNGIREFARGKGADFRYVPLTMPDLRVDMAALEEMLDESCDGHKLFAFPAQSNFSGVKHPLSLVQKAQQKGWDVCLDAAAYLPTNALDLSQIKPEFVTMSFYKMFGYPTGIGALLIRKSVFSKLQRPWFAGGTVNFASVQGEGHYLAANEAAFEDGTINYLNIPAIKIGLEHLQQVGMETIGERVRCLTGWLIDALMTLTHDNGRSLIRLYGPANTNMRGGTITLNFYDPDGHLLDYRRVEELANGEGISLRTGCFCNPGAGEIAEGLTVTDMQRGMAEGGNMSLPRFVQIISHDGGKSAGAIRVSVGIATNFTDIYRFLQFARSFLNQTNFKLGKVSYDIATCRVIRDGS